MYTYLVYLDIKPESVSLNKICQLLNSYEGIRFQPFGWFVKTSDMPGTLCEELSGLCDSEDYFVMTPVDPNLYFRQPESVQRWIRANI